MKKILVPSLVLSLSLAFSSMAAPAKTTKSIGEKTAQGVKKQDSGRVPSSHHVSRTHHASNYNMRGGVDLHLGGSGLSFGFGGHFTMDVPVFENGPGQSQVHFDLAYFPSTSPVSSAFMLGAYARYAFLIKPNIWMGPELGLGYFNSVSTTIAGVPVSGGGSTIILGLGGFAEGIFAPQWGWRGEVRILANAGSAFLLTGGVNYYF